ncbi:MAG: IPT/TIG domain-containing protein [Sandaracinus sp.]|nr:IPT/TIG domain-containing protein [Sandaracinus sp.]
MLVKNRVGGDRNEALGAGRSKAAAYVVGSLLLGLFGCDAVSTLTPPPTPRASETERDAGRAEFPDTGIGRDELLIARVVPDHGPFVGGNSAIVRGIGLTDEALVTVGGRMVQPADTNLVDDNRLAIVLPAGEPGPADVTVRVGEQEFTLANGYTYDAFYVEPTRGVVSGGTFVTVTGQGTGFAEGDTILFEGQPCTDVTIVSETVMTCRTPAGALGTADVAWVRAEDGATTTLDDVFEYYDSSDPFDGGLGGGPLTGTLNVTVLDAMTGLAVSDAFVILGEDLATEHQGLTGLTGQITFSGPDVMPPATVHAAKHCYEKTSFVAFDARDVTIFLVPWQDPMCGMGSGNPPTGRGRSGSFVSGELVFQGPNELGANPWDILPEPRTGWTRVAYVYATQPCAGDSLYCLNPDPGLGGGASRILEERPGSRGYPYRIFVRPSAMAIYALAGMENEVTREFRPYAMGVARNVVAGPGEEVRGVDVQMDIPLDHYLDVRLTELPGPGRIGPDRFVVSADIDLGGEGLIVRRVQNTLFDEQTQRSATRPFRFFAQPAIYGALSDGRYRIAASWVTGEFEGDPSAHVVRNGFRDVDREVELGGWVGLPVASAPAYGERIPADRVLRWTVDGGLEPTFYLVLAIGSDGNPAWRQFVPGTQTSAPIPDLGSIPEITDIPSGYVTWVVYSARIPGRDFDEITYADLDEDRWSAWALDVFAAQR